MFCFGNPPAIDAESWKPGHDLEDIICKILAMSTGRSEELCDLLILDGKMECKLPMHGQWMNGDTLFDGTIELTSPKIEQHYKTNEVRFFVNG